MAAIGFEDLSMNEQMTPPTSPAQLLHGLPSMSPYIVSHMYLEPFSPTHLEQHCVRQTDTTNLMAFAL